MRLCVYNGSPRGRRSNSRILLTQFLSGFAETTGNAYEIHFLSRTKELSSQVERFPEAETVLLCFPLYTDSMPGLVKAFIEALETHKGRSGNPKILFLVHSGFPEAKQSRPVERYLEKLARRLGCEYLGTIVKGGSEGVGAKPGWMTAKLFRQFKALGKGLGRTGRLDDDLLKEIAKPERYSGIARLFLPLGTLMSRVYWNQQMKKNGALDRKFDRPYQD